MLAMPIHPGTIRRAGKPWSGGSGSPFISRATRASSRALPIDSGRRTWPWSTPSRRRWRRAPRASRPRRASGQPARGRAAPTAGRPPPRDADRAEPPGGARRRRALLAAEEAAPVAGALDERGDLAARQPQQIGVAERDRPLAQRGALDLQPPGRRVDRRRGRCGCARRSARSGSCIPGPGTASQRISALVPKLRNHSGGVGLRIGAAAPGRRGRPTARPAAPSEPSRGTPAAAICSSRRREMPRRAVSCARRSPRSSRYSRSSVSSPALPPPGRGYIAE